MIGQPDTYRFMQRNSEASTRHYEAESFLGDRSVILIQDAYLDRLARLVADDPTGQEAA